MLLIPMIAAVLIAQQPPTAPRDWKLTWQDEFDGERLDLKNWSYVTGGNGFGNNELEYYTSRPENVSVRDGMLVITAFKQPYTGSDGVTREYTSARLQTEGKFAQAYGRFEARMKIPCGQGMWPAFWMMGQTDTTWPDRGEIDVMENIGREPGTVHGTIHGPGYSGANGIGSGYSLPTAQRFCDDFHVFAVEWLPDSIRWYSDAHLYKTTTPADLPPHARWVFNRPFYLLLNLAIGGDWPGSPDQKTQFPQSMYVDYVRVYEKQQTGPPH
jgi:beta-glucanase (GH16 family)